MTMLDEHEKEKIEKIKEGLLTNFNRDISDLLDIISALEGVAIKLKEELDCWRPPDYEKRKRDILSALASGKTSHQHVVVYEKLQQLHEEAKTPTKDMLHAIEHIINEQELSKEE